MVQVILSPAHDAGHNRLQCAARACGWRMLLAAFRGRGELWVQPVFAASVMVFFAALYSCSRRGVFA